MVCVCVGGGVFLWRIGRFRAGGSLDIIRQIQRCEMRETELEHVTSVGGIEGGWPGAVIHIMFCRLILLTGGNQVFVCVFLGSQRECQYYLQYV